MAKYHINSRGIAAVCRAKISCPLGASFDSKSEAVTVAEKERQEYTAKENEAIAKAKEDFNANLSKGNFSNVEGRMEYYKAEAIEDIHYEISKLRDGRPIIEIKNDLINNSNEIFYKKKELENEVKEKMLKTDEAQGIKNAEAEVEKWKSKLEEAENAVKDKNEGTCPKCGEGNLVKKSGAYGDFIGCSNFPKCKHTQKPVQINPGIKSKLTSAEHKLAVEKQQFDKKVEIEAAKEKDYQELNSEATKIEEKMKIARYIDSHENPRHSYQKSEITPIEKYYTERKAADEAIEKKIGTNKLAINSGSLRFGKNEIKERLTVDSKGNINNLYIEFQSKPGEVQRVVKLYDDGQGNIELENGEKLTMASVSNWKMDKNQSSPQAWKFYTTNSKSKKEYTGHRELIVHNIDTSD